MCVSFESPSASTNSRLAWLREEKGWQVSLLLLAATALRLIKLGGRPLWYDEAFAILYAEKPFATMLHGTIAQVGGAAADVHPIFFYSLLHMWMRVVGQSPFAVRSLSVILGVITVAVLYALVRALGGHRKGLAAAAIATVAPFAVYYSQEARMYALLGLAGLCTAYAFLRAWESRRWGWWLAFAVAGAVTLYAHNLGAFFIAALDIWGLFMFAQTHRPRQLIPWILSHILMLGLFAPWLVILPSQLGKIQQAYWVQQPGLVTLVQTLLVFHFSADNQALPPWLLPPALFFSLLLPVMVTYQLIRWRGSASSDDHASPKQRRWLLPILLCSIPVVLLFVVSQVRPVYIIRALLPSALAYYALLALVLFDRRLPGPIRWGLLAPAGVIVALSLFNHYTYTGFPRAPYEEVGAFLRTHTQPSDAIVHSSKLTFFPTYVYDRSLPQQFIADAPGSPEDTLAYPTQQALGLYATPDIETAAAGHDRVWLMLFDRAVAEYVEAGRNEHPHQLWLSQGYTLVSVTQFDSVSVYEYQIGPGPTASSLVTTGSQGGALHKSGTTRGRQTSGPHPPAPLSQQKLGGGDWGRGLAATHSDEMHPSQGGPL
jgi:mannosyltransferase